MKGRIKSVEKKLLLSLGFLHVLCPAELEDCDSYLVSVFLNIVLRSCVVSMPAAFEKLLLWLGWPQRLAKHVIFCETSLSILLTCMGDVFHVHLSRVGREVKQGNLVSIELISVNLPPKVYKIVVS